jgi:hypothetical protein
MKDDIGIAIIDVYSQNDLNACLEYLSIVNNKLIVSDTKNKIPENFNFKRYGSGVPFATLRNWAISQFRLQGNINHIFLINSNQIIRDINVFNESIKIANTFGTRVIFGPETSVLSIEDDKENIVLNLSEKINNDFIYISNDIVSEVGYFDERYLNTSHLDVLDYVERLREKKLHPPTGFNSMIDGQIEKSQSRIQKINYKEIHDKDKSVDMAYGYFFHKYSYIPSQNDPKPVSNDVLVKELEELQGKYAKK